MTNFYRPKLICIARCKNEIENIRDWYNSLPFVDVFLITDNGSTDGTYEFLRTLDNVIVTRVEGFHEGRDFQILLQMARSHAPEWIMKLDCDEFFEGDAVTYFPDILDQKKYDSVFFRKVALKSEEGDKTCYLTRDYFTPAIYLARLARRVWIRNNRIHVGGLRGFKNPGLSPLLVKHNHFGSRKKQKQKYETYIAVDLENKNKYEYLLNGEINKKASSLASAREGRYADMTLCGLDVFDFDERGLMTYPAKWNLTFIRKKVSIFRDGICGVIQSLWR